MIGLDTNVLVRYIMQDDPKQAALANKLIEGLTAATPGYVSLVAIVELVWVLESAFHLTRRTQTDNATVRLINLHQGGISVG